MNTLNLLTKPICKIFIYFVSVIPLLTFSHWQINTYLFTYLSVSGPLYCLLLIAKRCSEGEVGKIIQNDRIIFALRIYLLLSDY